jgi:hypothetical protein
MELSYLLARSRTAFQLQPFADFQASPAPTQVAFVTLFRHTCTEASKTTAQKPPWRCTFSQFLSFLELTLSPISQLRDDSRSDDEGRHRWSVPFRPAFLLHLFPHYCGLLIIIQCSWAIPG